MSQTLGPRLAPWDFCQWSLFRFSCFGFRICCQNFVKKTRPYAFALRSRGTRRSPLRLLAAVFLRLRWRGRLGFGRGARGLRRSWGRGHRLAFFAGARRAAVELSVQRPAEIGPRLLAVGIAAAPQLHGGNRRKRLLAIGVAAAPQLHGGNTRKRFLAVGVRATARARVATRARLPALGPPRRRLACKCRCANPTQRQDRHEESRSGHGLSILSLQAANPFPLY